jgi:4-amino-4-deoxy-L-arabinose transferase-like glycosyltransferase
MPKWFKWVFAVMACVYFAVWLYGALAAAHSSNIKLPIVSSDSVEYATLSDSILHHGTFTNADGSPNTFRTPGYPVFAAAVRAVGGGSFFAVTFVQIVLVFLIALLTERIGRRLFPGLAGPITATAFLLSPLTMTLPFYILSDPLFAFLYALFFYISIYRLEKRFWPYTIAAGIICGVAIYVRPMGIFAIPIFLAPLIATRLPVRKIIVAAVSVSVIAALLILPWMERNREETGVFSFSSLAPYNLAYNISMFNAFLNKTSSGSERTKIAETIGLPESSWQDLANSSILNSYEIGFFKANLFQYGKYHLITVMPFFFSSEIELYRSMNADAFGYQFDQAPNVINKLASGHIGSFLEAIVNPWWKFAERLFWSAIWLIAAYGLWKMRRNRLAWAMAFIIMYLALMTGPIANVRYRLPAEPFIFLLASVGAIYLCEKLCYKLRDTNKNRPAVTNA